MGINFPAFLISGFLLVACSASQEPAPADHTGSTEPDSVAGQFPANGTVNDRVNYYVTRLRSQLPMPVNDSTVMDRVSRNGLEIELHYDVLDRSVVAQQLEAWLADNALANTCNNPMTAQMVRDGASFRYTYSGGSLQRPISRIVDRC